MSSDPAILLQGLSKSYPVYGKPHHRLLQMLSRDPGRWYREFHALSNVDLSVARGETLGIVGRNGSGKSTLLQLICGTLAPTTGSVRVNGRIAALLELGAGFNPEFTGRENVFLNGSILGLTRDEVEQRFDDIAAFADIGDFIDQPVKTYSSGMYVRLAFAVAINVEPDILVIDEALSVGDEGFQRKCFARIESIRERGATVLFVSHSAGTVVDLCDRAILLDHGECIAQGTPKHVIAQYQRMLHAPADRTAAIRAQIADSRGDETADADLSAPGAKAALEPYWEEGLQAPATVVYENRGADVEDPHLETLAGMRVNVLVPGQYYVYVYRVRLHHSFVGVRCGMMIRTTTGVDLGGCVTPSNPGKVLDAGSVLEVRLRFRCGLTAGTYFLNAGVVAHLGHGEEYVNRWVDVGMFRVLVDRSSLFTGLVDFDVSTQLKVTA